MIAPASEPMMPLGRSARPSPANRLMTRPPTNEPPTPAAQARPQSMPDLDLPTISWATAPTSSPNRMIPMISMAGVWQFGDLPVPNMPYPEWIDVG